MELSELEKELQEWGWRVRLDTRKRLLGFTIDYKNWEVRITEGWLAEDFEAMARAICNVVGIAGRRLPDLSKWNDADLLRLRKAIDERLK